MKSPLDFFFSLGDRVTKGDMKRKADFDYSMLWIIFLAFAMIFGTNIYYFITQLDFAKLGWGVVMFGIMWFQYFNLKAVRESRKLMKNINVKPETGNDTEIEDVKGMMEGFNDGK